MLLKKRYNEDLDSDERPSLAELKSKKKKTTTATDKFKTIRGKREDEVQTNDVLFKQSVAMHKMQDR